VRRMMREASDLPADMVILPWIKLEHLDQDAIAAYRRRVLILDERSPLAEFDGIEFLQTIDGYRKDLHSGEEGVTVAGLLMFGKEAAIREWRARHLIDARLLPPGADIGEPDWADRVTWEGHLFGAYNSIYPWLTHDLPVPFRLENGVRIGESEQHRALREALVNLLVHADYAERDASLILRWDGGVLFRNPGRSRIPSPGFHGGNRSDPRNPALLRMFRRIGYAEEAGTGMPRIFRSWRDLGFEPPHIDAGDERYEFAITLPYQHLLSEDDRVWLAGLGVPLAQEEQLALVIARHDNWVDNQSLRGVTGLHGADASRVLTGLRDREHLEMNGSKRGAVYRLPVALIDPNMMISDTDMMISDTSIVDNGPNMMISSANSTDNELSLEDSDPTSVYSKRLQQIAAPAQARKRMPPDQLRNIIVELCAVQTLSAPELAQLLSRSEIHIRQMICALVDTGEILPVHRARRHPGQRYTVR
jgi:ATP-dependent DNA helicase RecG